MTDPLDRLTAADIEREYGLSRAALRKRRSRGQLRPVGYTTDRGHAALYLRRDVERVMCHTVASRSGVPGDVI